MALSKPVIAHEVVEELVVQKPDVEAVELDEVNASKRYPVRAEPKFEAEADQDIVTVPDAWETRVGVPGVEGVLYTSAVVDWSDKLLSPPALVADTFT